MTIDEFEILNGFLGYGNRDATVVFVGLEEACNERTINQNYLQRVDVLKGLQLVDLNDFHTKHTLPDMRHWFEGAGKSQSLWNYICQIMCVNKGNSTPSPRDRLNYQIKELGQSSGDTCLLEFYPLPRPNHNYWNSSLSVPGYFDNSDNYKDFCRKKNIIRLNQIHSLINNSKCKTIFLYGVMEKGDLRPDVKEFLPGITVINRHTTFGNKVVLECLYEGKKVFCSYFFSSRFYTLDGLATMAKLI